jgi:CBS-domain-containing membrane protein
MRELTVAMVMTKDPVTVAPETETGEIARVLARNSISAVPVVRGDGVPMGVVTRADLNEEGQAGDVMTIPVRAVDANESVSFAARQLNRRGVRRLFVVDHGRLVGVVSRRDLLRMFLRSDEEIQADVEREVFQRVLWADLAAVAVSVNRGMVTLNGQLGRRSEVEIASRLTATIPGVIEVRNRLDYAWDDPVR